MKNEINDMSEIETSISAFIDRVQERIDRTEPLEAGEDPELPVSEVLEKFENYYLWLKHYLIEEGKI